MAARVLVVCNGNSSAFLVAQAELLAQQLILQGYQTEITTQLNPARLLSHRYDLIHLLSTTMDLSLATWAALGLAKTQRTGLIYSHFSSQWNSHPLSQIFDSITVLGVSQLQSLKLFTCEKMVFAGLSQSTRHYKQSSMDHLILEALTAFSGGFIFPILEDLEEIPSSAHLQSSFFLIDATRLSEEKLRTVKHQWSDWKKSNLLFENAFMVTHPDTLGLVAKQNKCVLVTSHLNLGADQLHSMIQFVRDHKCRWIPNSDQASAFSHAWHQLNKRIVADSSFTFLDHNLSESETFTFTDTSLNETKLNELSRVYQRVLTKINSHSLNRSDKIEAM